MTRVFISDERVARLRDRLIPLFAAAGSINALCATLNQALGGGGGRVIYPNRLHAILSEETTRSLNEASVGLIEGAADALIAADAERTVAGERLLREMQARARALWTNAAARGDAVAEVAQALQVPPAVAARLVRDIGGDLPSPPRPARGASRQPDWSFQDMACRRCLESLERGPGRKVGLVIPTGGGKTRVALRIALRVLEQHPTGRVVWITHLHNLREQTHRHLHRMLNEEPRALPPDAFALAERIDFLMVSRLAAALADHAVAPLLVIIDEAHHAAAESYQPLRDASPPVRGLFLTATPNRTDDLPLGIDEIAFTITYRELAERGVILMPTFRPFAVANFNWSDESLADLADDLLENAEGDYVKTLVICPSIVKVEALHRALVDRLDGLPKQVLKTGDIGFVHSERVSHGGTSAGCLAYFADKPRGILVSANMLLEGHDDPTVNTVVVTYRTESLIKLMQAAGRCVRYSPGKTAAFVVYASDRDLQYRFDQRWLYQEIDDRLLPELIDLDYARPAQLMDSVADLLERHNVPAVIRDRAVREATALAAGDRFRVLLSGLSYFGPVDEFAARAAWSAITETPPTTAEFRQVFNEFCRIGADLPATSDFLRHAARSFGLAEDLTPASRWKLYHDMLAAMQFAREEVYADGSQSPFGTSRPYRPGGPTTWLKYVTFHYRPELPPELEAFLADCFNRDAVAAEWPEATSREVAVVKLPLPLAGFEAVLLAGDAAGAFRAACEAARAKLAVLAPAEQLSSFFGWRAGLQAQALPWRVLEKLDRYLPPAEFERLVFVWPPIGVTLFHPNLRGASCPTST